MYIEETGAGDGDIKVTVEGEEYTAEANYDLDGDGVDETVAIMTDEGYVAYVDENADGAADVMQSVDPHGNVVEQARFDVHTGDWVAERPDQHAPGQDQQTGGQSMVVDTPQGDREVGPATEDTNNDGTADTAVVTTDKGTMLVTDVDGDGSADQMVEVQDSGEVTISQHTGDGEWTVVEKGRIDGNGEYKPNPNAGVASTDDAAWTFDEPQQGRAPGADSDSVWS